MKVKGSYPGLKEFAEFMVKETERVCDPAMNPDKDKKPNKENSKESRRSYSTTAKKPRCIYCNKENHYIDECKKFGAIPVKERQE
ncbi:hypothetical protein HOLleu_38746 [Holothuria leucospilota]|uniref:CCHC-type domain-containing protein n=1 Tax=Holothuria leucospilota TaxID=206669 RepID=A0A9Q1BEC2_HOLLE|nr:hypothetical protein HOLleu_38746 [Holothuria leucospilota]